VSKIFSINLAESLRVRMEAAAGRMTAEAQAKLQQATRNLAEMAYAKAHEIANQELNETAQLYKDNLKFEEVAPGVFSVGLMQPAEWLENGVDSYDMKPILTKNGKTSKKGYKYKVIPFQHKSSGQASGSSGDLLSDLKRLRKGLGDEGITKDDQGNPLLGKIWSARPDDTGMWGLNPAQKGVSPSNARFAEPGISPNLQGIVKYQYNQKLRNGSSRTRSSFVTFRVVSMDPKYANKFIYPSTKPGKQIMQKTFDWTMQTLSQILDEIFQ
jgi:hypothetical protein